VAVEGVSVPEVLWKLISKQLLRSAHLAELEPLFDEFDLQSLTLVSGKAAVRVAMSTPGLTAVKTSITTTSTTAVCCVLHEPSASDFCLGVLGLAMKLNDPSSGVVLTLPVKSAPERQVIHLVPSDTSMTMGTSIELSASRVTVVRSMLNLITKSITCGANKVGGVETELEKDADPDEARLAPTKPDEEHLAARTMRVDSVADGGVTPVPLTLFSSLEPWVRCPFHSLALSPRVAPRLPAVDAGVVRSACLLTRAIAARRAQPETIMYVVKVAGGAMMRQPAFAAGDLALELHNSLQRAVGNSIGLSSTLMFDHPTARQVALQRVRVAQSGGGVTRLRGGGEFRIEEIGMLEATRPARHPAFELLRSATGSLTFVSGESAFQVAVNGLGCNAVTTSTWTTTSSSDNIIGVTKRAQRLELDEASATKFRLGVLGLASKLAGPRSDGVLTLRVESALERQIINLVPSEMPAIVGASVELSASHVSAVLSQCGQIITSITRGAIEDDGAEMEWVVPPPMPPPNPPLITSPPVASLVVVWDCPPAESWDATPEQWQMFRIKSAKAAAQVDAKVALGETSISSSEGASVANAAAVDAASEDAAVARAREDAAWAARKRVCASPPPATKPTNGNPPRGPRHPAWSMDRRGPGRLRPFSPHPWRSRRVWAWLPIDAPPSGFLDRKREVDARWEAEAAAKADAQAAAAKRLVRIWNPAGAAEVATTEAVAFGCVTRLEAGVAHLAMSCHGHRTLRPEADELKSSVARHGHRVKSFATGDAEATGVMSSASLTISSEALNATAASPAPPPSKLPAAPPPSFQIQYRCLAGHHGTLDGVRADDSAGAVLRRIAAKTGVSQTMAATLRLAKGRNELDLHAPCGLGKGDTVHVLGRLDGGTVEESSRGDSPSSLTNSGAPSQAADMDTADDAASLLPAVELVADAAAIAGAASPPSPTVSDALIAARAHEQTSPSRGGCLGSALVSRTRSVRVCLTMRRRSVGSAAWAPPPNTRPDPSHPTTWTWMLPSLRRSVVATLCCRAPPAGACSVASRGRRAVRCST
jgi:hypothetical protein